MRFLIYLSATALLVAMGLGGTMVARAADRDVRSQIMGRQKIREELSAALAKGYLTRMDQYHILLDAKEVLSPDDLHGLEQTLNRIATRQASTRTAATAVPSTIPASPNAAGARDAVTASRYEEPQAEEGSMGKGPRPTKAKIPSDGPTLEEIPPGSGTPAMQSDGGDPDGYGCDPEGCDPEEFHLFGRHWLDIELFSSVDAFKGPLDFSDANGNFGTRLGVNGAVPILPRLGVGMQAGTSVVLSNLEGTPYPFPNSTLRDQLFTTVGMFQRFNREDTAFTWGFAYDWLFDDYYSNFHFGQWRVKAAYEFSACNEFGLEASLPEQNSWGNLPFIGDLEFAPITQGSLYWKHTWCNDASLTARFGMAERPGLFLFGAESRVPLTTHLALTSEFTYIMPNSGAGFAGQTEEIWNVSVGVELVLGGFGHGCANRFQPFLPVANNGSFAIRQVQ